VSATGGEIDRLVYDLHGPTDEEIAIVEGEKMGAERGAAPDEEERSRGE